MADALGIRIGGFHPQLMRGGILLTSHTLDAATDAIEWIWRAPEPITITRIGFRYTLRTGTPPTFIAQLEGVDASGNPDGTAKGGGTPASATFTPPASTAWDSTWQWITLANAYTCTRSETLAIVIKHSSGTIDGSNFSTIAYVYGNSAESNFPYAIANNATARTRSARMPLFGIGSASRVFGYPIEVAVNTTVMVSSTPDEMALRFLLPAAWGQTFQVLGARVNMRCTTAAHIGRLILYDGTTVLQSVDFDTDLVQSAAVLQFMDIFFDETTLSTLNFGSEYRIAIQPQNAGNLILDGLQVDVAADMEPWEGGVNFYLSTRTDAGAWTDDQTKQPWVQLILADWTEPSGSGGPVGSGRLTGGLQ